MSDTPTGAPLAAADALVAGLLEEPGAAAELEAAGVAALEEVDELEELEELHAASAAVAQRAAAAYSARRWDGRRAPSRVGLFVELSIYVTPLRGWHGSTLRSFVATLSWVTELRFRRPAQILEYFGTTLPQHEDDGGETIRQDVAGNPSATSE
jgi:hypothetical protein